MSITAQPNFNANIKWSNGAGCLACGSNVSELGDKVGIRCIDLGVDDEWLGRFGLCYDCALQVARVIDFVAKDVVADTIAEAEAKYADAEVLLTEAQAAAAQAKLDKDTVERLIGSVYAEAV